MHRLWKTDVKNYGENGGSGYHTVFDPMPNGGIQKFPQ